MLALIPAGLLNYFVSDVYRNGEPDPGLNGLVEFNPHYYSNKYRFNGVMLVMSKAHDSGP